MITFNPQTLQEVALSGKAMLQPVHTNPRGIDWGVHIVTLQQFRFIKLALL